MSGGSSLWGWHGGDCAWARGRGVWRQGGAWVWQRAGSGQQVALNSCHNGRALGCGGSEPRPERQRWHGGGRRQVRVWRVRHGHRQVRWGERGRGEREMVVMPMQVRRRGEVNTDGVG